MSVGHEYNKELDVQVGIHQDSVLRTFLFIIVHQTITYDILMKLLSYRDFISELNEKFQVWNQKLESKVRKLNLDSIGLKVKLANTKVLVSKKTDIHELVYSWATPLK